MRPTASVTGVRHAWTFDDMFSVFAMQGIEAKKKGEFTREELAPLAEVNVTSLKEYDFFTQGQGGRQEGGVQRAASRLLSRLHKKDTVLTLHFMLPLKAPVKAKDLSLEIYDREFFVDFSFEDKDPAKLVGAPAQVQARGRAAAGHGRRAVAAAEPARSRPARSLADHRRRVRQQDLGEMPMKAAAGGRPRLAKLLVAVAVVLLVAGAVDAALAQAGPFGGAASAERAASAQPAA